MARYIPVADACSVKIVFFPTLTEFTSCFYSNYVKRTLFTESKKVGSFEPAQYDQILNNDDLGLGASTPIDDFETVTFTRFCSQSLDKPVVWFPGHF